MGIGRLDQEEVREGGLKIEYLGLKLLGLDV